ncbi:MAG: DMT family transporter [Actinobacteria bacterium]|nr:DMT family transporter [Actinomycetota bacterium]NIS34947.1 DMT family transporter [Actinomycetota bacterium]NIT97836.1 DMT family transporter [Actinomycetota bacterium]NIU21493.1 DMT family transporter [Actinomycetota bacterium]NIU69687.1 DMT family transporter [Actinomycetota bacterium]
MTTTEARVRPEDAPFAPLDWVLLISAASIWGASFLFMAIGLDAFEPGVVTFLRIGFGTATLAALPAARQPIDRADRGRVALLGFTWMAFPLTLFPIAQQWIDSSMAGMLNSAMPVMTVLVTWLVFATPTGPRRLFGVVVGVGGVLLIGLPEASTDDTNAVGVLLVVIAVGSYGVAVNLAGPLQQRYGSLPVTARALAYAMPMVVPYALWGVPDSSLEAGPLLACFVLGAGGTGAAFVFATTLTGRVGAVRTSIVTYIVPVVSVVLGVGFRDEQVTIWAVLGTAVVLIGAWISSRTG